MTTQTMQDQVLDSERRSAAHRTQISTPLLYRCGGAAVVVGGLLGALSETLHPADPTGPAGLAAYAQTAQWVHVIMFVGVFVLLLGLPAVYLRQSAQAGRVGLLGFVLLFVGVTLLAIPHSAIDILLLPALAQQVPTQLFAILSGEGGDTIASVFWLLPEPTVVIGAVLWAVTTLRARVLPAWPACLLLVALVFNLFWNSLALLPDMGWEPGPVLFYLALAGFGLSLVLGKAIRSAQSDEKMVNGE